MKKNFWGRKEGLIFLTASRYQLQGGKSLYGERHFILTHSVFEVWTKSKRIALTKLTIIFFCRDTRVCSKQLQIIKSVFFLIIINISSSKIFNPKVFTPLLSLSNYITYPWSMFSNRQTTWVMVFLFIL